MVGDNASFKRTLIERLSELKAVYKDVMEYVKTLKKAHVYFSSFIVDVLGSDINLTMLQYIMSN